MIFTEIKKRDYLLTVLLSMALFVITFAIVFKQSQMPATDYYLHMDNAAHFKELVPYHITYPMWHFLVYAVYKAGWYLLGNMPLEYACAIVTSLINVSIFLIIKKIISSYECLLPALIAFALCLVTPIYIPWYNESLYVDQWSPVTWHNPTNFMVKPFALIAFCLVILILEKIKKKENIARKEYVFLTITVLLSVLAKPSFFQGFVPALGIYILIVLIYTRFRDFKKYVLLCLCFLPGLIIVILQFYFAFYTGKGGGVGIGWMEAMSQSHNPLIAVLLVLLFPLTYIILNINKCKINTPIQVSGLFTIVSWLEYALLFENGVRKYHSNFSWALQLSYTVLWVVTTALFFKDLKEMDMHNQKAFAKNTVLLIIWLAHLACGIYYAWSLITVEGMWM
ncbi:MAG: hypothetical protein IKE43_05190 [Coriobacteriales bacterium]|nr:hypothetical protein [Coriobacteriales bacterium]